MNHLQASGRRRHTVEAWMAVVATYHACEARYAQLLGSFGLSVAQFEVLSLLEGRGGSARPSEIASGLLVTKGNVTALLGRLQAAGWVDIAADPDDGRARTCRLAPDAVKVVREARAAASRFIEAQCAPFTTTELAHVENLMKRMHKHLLSMDVATLAGGRVGRGRGRGRGRA